MIVLDVDCFKLVNDNYGHSFGDKVLACLAMLLKEVFRDNDSILMRAGGDEFVIFVKDILNIELVRKNVELMQNIWKQNSVLGLIRSVFQESVLLTISILTISKMQSMMISLKRSLQSFVLLFLIQESSYLLVRHKNQENVY